jgi:CHASE2 domain-containing sensor protein
MKAVGSILLKATATMIIAALIAYGISAITDRINLVENFSLAASDVDFTDIYYKVNRHEIADTNIVIVNIGTLDRERLAALFRKIGKCEPAVLGIDILFTANADSIQVQGTRTLVAALNEIPNVVLAAPYNADGKEEVPQSKLIRHVTTESIVNFNVALDDPESGTIRSFHPKTNVDGKEMLFFGHEIVNKFNGNLTSAVNSDEQFIRWYGYARRGETEDMHAVFASFDHSQVLASDFPHDNLKGKIVLAGFMGETIYHDYNPHDKFYSPLNHKMVGRALPDIFAIEVHANALKMILDDELIYHSKAVDFIINFLFVLIFVIICMWLYKRYKNQYSLISKALLILYIDILLIAIVVIFHLSEGGFKIFAFESVFVLLFVPDTYEFLMNNLFNRKIFLLKANNNPNESQLA